MIVENRVRIERHRENDRERNERGRDREKEEKRESERTRGRTTRKSYRCTRLHVVHVRGPTRRACTGALHT